MAAAVMMPRQGQSVESCILTRWFKKKGDAVKEGDLLFAYETDKAAFEEEARMDGILLEVFFSEGEEVPVLTNVAVIGSEGEEVTPFRPGKTKARVESDETLAEVKPVVPPAQEIRQTTAPGKASPRARKLAGKMKVDISALHGSGPVGRIIERDVEEALRNKQRITPLARAMIEKDRLVVEDGILAPGQRITSRDLKKPSGPFEMVPLSNVRRRVAQAMTKSLQTAAQLTHHTSADARKILALREEIKKKREKTDFPNITLNDMVCFALARAVKAFPEANAHFMDDHMRIFRQVHLGMAVDTERGLLVPVLEKAEGYSLPELSLRLAQLAEKCKKGNIDPDLLSSEKGSITVTNLGALGVEMFTPVLNLPQVCILGVNTIVMRPAELKSGAFGFIPVIGLSLTYDHRAIDGAPASRFLAEIRNEVENINALVE